MNIIIELEKLHYKVDLDSAQSLAIPLIFAQDGSETADSKSRSQSRSQVQVQPNHFSAPLASSKPLRGGSFIGDTEQGGSCNVSELYLIPHCNGTHTETVAHICHDAIEKGRAISDIKTAPLMPAVLLSIKPVKASSSEDNYRPSFDDGDFIVSKKQLVENLEQFTDKQLQVVLIRTLPNNDEKKSRCYDESNAPPFFSIEAIEYLNQRGVMHLMVDFPSIDRMYDEGKLTCHHLFWNVQEECHTINALPLIPDFTHKTITEMCFVPNHIKDGFHFINLQFPEFSLDAAPSRPVLYFANKFGK